VLPSRVQTLNQYNWAVRKNYINRELRYILVNKQGNKQGEKRKQCMRRKENSEIKSRIIKHVNLYILSFTCAEVFSRLLHEH
jgi:hypothetical protein